MSTFDARNQHVQLRNNEGFDPLKFLVKGRGEAFPPFYHIVNHSINDFEVPFCVFNLIAAPGSIVATECSDLRYEIRKQRQDTDTIIACRYSLHTVMKLSNISVTTLIRIQKTHSTPPASSLQRCVRPIWRSLICARVSTQDQNSFD
jgi:hypothetical protein